jgi:hypothetical protein
MKNNFEFLKNVFRVDSDAPDTSLITCMVRFLKRNALRVVLRWLISVWIGVDLFTINGMVNKLCYYTEFIHCCLLIVSLPHNSVYVLQCEHLYIVNPSLSLNLMVRNTPISKLSLVPRIFKFV